MLRVIVILYILCIFVAKHKVFACNLLDFFVCVVLEFELRACTLSHSTSPFFVKGFFEIESHATILLSFKLQSS
jgi:hypothetical protein